MIAFIFINVITHVMFNDKIVEDVVKLCYFVKMFVNVLLDEI